MIKNQSDLDHQGYVHIKNVFNENECEMLLDSLSALNGDSNPLESFYNSECYLTSLIKINSLIKESIDDKLLYACWSSFRYQDPDRTHISHHDKRGNFQTTDEINSNPSLASRKIRSLCNKNIKSWPVYRIWIVLCDQTNHSGGTKLLPFSHQTNNSTKFRRVVNNLFQSISLSWIYPKARKGDVIIFNLGLYHAGYSLRGRLFNFIFPPIVDNFIKKFLFKYLPQSKQLFQSYPSNRASIVHDFAYPTMEADGYFQNRFLLVPRWRPLSEFFTNKHSSLSRKLHDCNVDFLDLPKLAELYRLSKNVTKFY